MSLPLALLAAYPRAYNVNNYASLFTDLFGQYKFTPIEMRHFLAQVLHESGGLSRTVENLNYSTPDRIRAVWPTRFPTIASAAPYVNNAMALGNKVYQRAELGNDKPGDGFKFRGRGLIQTTGKANYGAVSQLMFGDNRLVAEPELLEQPQHAAHSAVIEWRRRGLDKVAKDNSEATIKAITRSINGVSMHGLAERIALFKKLDPAILATLTGGGKKNTPVAPGFLNSLSRALAGLGGFFKG